MATATVAGKWVVENSNLKHERMAHWGKPKQPRNDFQVYLRKCAKRDMTAREFVEANRNAKSNECIFVPYATKGQPKQVSFCGKMISAARYMALLTLGAPKTKGIVVRHLCGNGHLSCVNPAHLAWGTASENRSDAQKHRSAETPEDKLNALYGRL